MPLLLCDYFSPNKNNTRLKLKPEGNEISNINIDLKIRNKIDFKQNSLKPIFYATYTCYCTFGNVSSLTI